MSGPFSYPPSAHVRRHGPGGYADYESFRPWLRDEFAFRCVYCLNREQWCRVRCQFALDHFKPTAHHPGRALEYDNLVYSCAACNLAKGDRPIPDPLVFLTAATIRVSAFALIETDNPDAALVIERVGLNRPEAIEFR